MRTGSIPRIIAPIFEKVSCVGAGKGNKIHCLIIIIVVVREITKTMSDLFYSCPGLWIIKTVKDATTKA